MKTPDISPEVEASMVSLAGDWAREWADEDVRNLSDISKWEKVFISRFNTYYTIIFKAVIEARKDNSGSGSLSE